MLKNLSIVLCAIFILVKCPMNHYGPCSAKYTIAIHNYLADSIKCFFNDNRTQSNQKSCKITIACDSLLIAPDEILTNNLFYSWEGNFGCGFDNYLRELVYQIKLFAKFSNDTIFNGNLYPWDTTLNEVLVEFDNNPYIWRDTVNIR